MPKKLYIKTMGCQMNEYDSDKMADVLRVVAWLRTDDSAGRRRFAADEHLFDSREGSGESVFRTRALACAEGEPARCDDRRWRLCREPGRRGDQPARAVRRHGIRTADPASLARMLDRSQDNAAARCRYLVSRNRKIRLPVRSRAPTDRPRSFRSWKAAASIVRSASCPTPVARKSAARWTVSLPKSWHWPSRVCARSICSARM